MMYEHEVECVCGHRRVVHCGCGPGYHATIGHSECCDECECVGFVARNAAATCGPVNVDGDGREA